MYIVTTKPSERPQILKSDSIDELEIAMLLKFERFEPLDP